MSKYQKKKVVVEAITFDEFVEHGLQNSENIVEGMPWSFDYKGHPITHETDEIYLIPTQEGTMNMTPNDMLITGVKGEIYPCKKDIFDMTYTKFQEVDLFDFKGVITPEQSLEKDIKCNKQLRVSLDKELQRLKNLKGSRERSLAITKLQESIMWLGMDLKRLNEPNPYPDSYNPSNAKIAPTADSMKM